MSTVAMYDRVSQSLCMYYLIESCKHARNSPPKKGLLIPKILCARTCTEAGSAETALTAGAVQWSSPNEQARARRFGWRRWPRLGCSKVLARPRLCRGERLIDGHGPGPGHLLPSWRLGACVRAPGPGAAWVTTTSSPPHIPQQPRPPPLHARLEKGRCARVVARRACPRVRAKKGTWHSGLWTSTTEKAPCGHAVRPSTTLQHCAGTDGQTKLPRPCRRQRARAHTHTHTHTHTH